MYFPISTFIQQTKSSYLDLNFLTDNFIDSADFWIIYTIIFFICYFAFLITIPICLQCKRLVLDFGPLIFANAEKFLETTDICTALHVCNKTPTVLESFLSYLLSRLYHGNHLFRVVHLLKVALS